MATVPRPPSDHYGDAERLIAAVRETPQNALLLAIAHGVLAGVPPKSLRGQHRRPKYTPPTNDSDDSARDWGWPS